MFLAYSNLGPSQCPRRPTRASRRPKGPPRGLQDGPRRALDGPGGPDDGPRRPQDGPNRRPRGFQEGPRRAQEAPRRHQEAPKRPQEARRGPPEAPRRPPTSPKRLKNCLQDAPKRSPICLQDAPPKKPKNCPQDVSQTLTFEQQCCKTMRSSMISHLEPFSGSSKSAPKDVVQQLFQQIMIPMVSQAKCSLDDRRDGPRTAPRGRQEGLAYLAPLLPRYVASTSAVADMRGSATGYTYIYIYEYMYIHSHGPY